MQIDNTQRIMKLLNLLMSDHRDGKWVYQCNSIHSANKQQGNPIHKVIRETISSVVERVAFNHVVVGSIPTDGVSSLSFLLDVVISF